MICASGFNESSKNKLKEQIESGGGVYSGDLVLGKTTHLIVKEARGAKYDAAKLWKIPIVKIEWVQESLEAGYCLPEKTYLAASPTTDNQTSTPTSDDRTVRAVTSSSSAASSSAMAASMGAKGAVGSGMNKQRPPEIDISCIGGGGGEKAGINAINETEAGMRNTSMSQTMNANFSMTFSPATTTAAAVAASAPKVQTKYTDLLKELSSIGKITLTLLDGIGVSWANFLFYSP